MVGPPYILDQKKKSTMCFHKNKNVVETRCGSAFLRTANHLCNYFGRHSELSTCEDIHWNFLASSQDA